MNAQPKNETASPINGMSSKLGTLERRLEHLERRLDERGEAYRNCPAADFDRAEIAMLKAARTCMQTHQGAVNAKKVLYWRGSPTDLATDIKALGMSTDELAKLRGAL